MLAGHKFKGYLPGGASGGILPASMGDIPLDFGQLEKHGCFVGSHAVVILSDKDDMKDVALNLMRFFEEDRKELGVDFIFACSNQASGFGRLLGSRCRRNRRNRFLDLTGVIAGLGFSEPVARLLPKPWSGPPPDITAPSTGRPASRSTPAPDCCADVAGAFICAAGTSRGGTVRISLRSNS